MRSLIYGFDGQREWRENIFCVILHKADVIQYDDEENKGADG